MRRNSVLDVLRVRQFDDIQDEISEMVDCRSEMVDCRIANMVVRDIIRQRICNSFR